MTFPKYDAYKHSGAVWLGEIPARWSTKRIKRIFEIRKRIAGSSGHTVLAVTQQGVKRKDIESGEGQLALDYSKYQLVEVGDFAMNHMDLLTGYVDISPIYGVTSPDYRVFAIRDPSLFFDRYYLYVLQMGYKSKIFFAFGQGSSQLGRWRFPADQFNDFQLPVPAIREQRDISSFLDYETNKIDALLAEQEKLIGLLREKRQNVISNAVTKGLTPDVGTIPTAIDWLGSVPARWMVRPLKYLVSFRSGSTPSKENVRYWGGDIPWASAKDMKTDELSDTEDHITDDAITAGTVDVVPAQSVVVVVRGMILARTFPVTILTVPMAINQDLKALMPKAEVNPRFLAWYLRGTAAESLNRLDEAGHGTKALRMDAWASLPVALPPMEEQICIADFVESTVWQLDALIAETRKAIDILGERRIALISAAVMGKIDVRDLAPDRTRGAAA
jgi:type I restriction enzyme, S subunit